MIARRAFWRVVSATPGLRSFIPAVIRRRSRLLPRPFGGGGVDLVGLSCLSGAHRALFQKVVQLLREKGASDITVIGGGIIHEQDFPMLYEAGIKAIFTPGASLDSIVEWIKTNIKPH